MARLTREQALLKVLHGTVEEFTDKCIEAIGDISKAEALEAIRAYRVQWHNAGWKGNKEKDDVDPNAPSG